MTALKFAGFTEGDTIRAYDFEPIEGRPERYIEGKITNVLTADDMQKMGREPFACYVVRVEIDTCAPKGTRELVFVPHETSMDYDGRVRKIEREHGIDAARLVQFGRAVLKILAEREQWSADTMDEIAGEAIALGLAPEGLDRFEIALQPDVALGCENCGARFEQFDAMADAGGWGHCPDCGSSCLAKITLDAEGKPT